MDAHSTPTPDKVIEEEIKTLAIKAGRIVGPRTSLACIGTMEFGYIAWKLLTP